MAAGELKALRAEVAALRAELAAERARFESEKRELQAARSADTDQLKLQLRVAEVEFFEWLPGKEFTASPGYRRLVGIAPDATMSNDIDDWLPSVHPADRMRLQERWRNPVEGILPSIDYRIVVDSKVRWLRSASVVHRNAAGGIDKVIGVSRDVSAEYAARDTATRLESLLQTASACIWMLDPRGRIVMANRAFCEGFGCTSDELSRFTILDLCFPEDLDKRVEWARQLLAEGQFSATWRVRKRSGEECWLSVDAATFVPPGEEQRYFLFVGTDAHRAQAERLSLIDQQQWLDQIMRDARVGAVRVERRTMRADLVGAYSELYDQKDPHMVSLEELLGLISPSHRDAFRDRIFALVRHGELDTIDYPILLADGSERWLRAHMRVQRGEGDDPGVITAILLDKTNDYRRTAERELLQQQVYQAQKSESLGVMAGGIAHDLNNMLMAALGQLNLALAAVPKDTPLGRYLQTVDGVLGRMEGLTERMLAYAGKSSGKRVPIDIADLLDTMEPLLRASAGRFVRLRYHVEGAGLFVRGDDTLIEQVILNLVQNAVDAIGERGGAVRIRATAVASGDIRPMALQWPIADAESYVELSIRDDGPGMDEETARRIFEPFFTSKETGRGLGLSVVQGIVREHGGSVRLTTQLGIGTEFKLYLPRISTPPMAGRSMAVAIEALPAQAAIEVLAIDDDEDVLAITVVMLEQCGYNVSAFLSGDDAVALFAQEPDRFKVAVIDLTMPVKDGATIARELRAIDSELPILFVSGYSKQHALELCAEDDITNFLRKPFRSEALSAKLTQLIERVKAQTIAN